MMFSSVTQVWPSTLTRISNEQQQLIVYKVITVCDCNYRHDLFSGWMTLFNRLTTIFVVLLFVWPFLKLLFICLTRACSPVLWIPGDHLPPSSLSPAANSTRRSGSSRLGIRTWYIWNIFKNPCLIYLRYILESEPDICMNPIYVVKT